MRTLVVLMMCLVPVAFPAHADSNADGAPVTMSVKLGVGLGWSLCKHSDTPPDIETAFECSGMTALPREVDLVLQKKPAQNPAWLYYEAPYTETESFRDVTTQVELMVAYAVYGSHHTGYVDGRVTSRQYGVDSAPVYFRMSAEGGLPQINYDSPYGAAVPMGDDLDGYDYWPVVAIQGIQ